MRRKRDVVWLLYISENGYLEDSIELDAVFATAKAAQEYYGKGVAWEYQPKWFDEEPALYRVRDDRPMQWFPHRDERFVPPRPMSFMSTSTTTVVTYAPPYVYGPFEPIQRPVGTYNATEIREAKVRT